MALFQRFIARRAIITQALRAAGSRLTLMLFVAGMYAAHCAAQVVEDGVGLRSPFMVYGTVGGENTNLPAYADNALGFDLGASYQPRGLVGAEFRTTAYPFSATYLQMSFTGGYRIARRSILGFPYRPFAYFGGGWARSQDKGLSRKAYPPEWEPCWQADIGLDRTYRYISWRVMQVSMRETYASLNTLRSLGLSTGIVYDFHR